MFTACIHCNLDLGRNEAFETFPVGKRLAFDAALGRLWVVCTHCARWNLTPLDERWETIEAAERRFRDSRLRVSTDNVGLARLREGLDLIRIGSPQRPEMAAWRYGDQFGRRRKRQLLITGALVGGAATIAGGMLAAGASVTILWNLVQWRDTLLHGRRGATVARIALTDGRLVRLKRHEARAATIVRANSDSDSDMGFSLRFESDHKRYTVEGDDARRAAAKLLPVLNRYGGSPTQVQDAVRLLEEAGDPHQIVHAMSRRLGRSDAEMATLPWYRRKAAKESIANRAMLQGLPLRDRLALEMALHEESERRAMDGELAQLKAAWREAEEIAHIADNLFVLPSVEEQFAALRRKARGDERQ